MKGWIERPEVPTALLVKLVGEDVGEAMNRRIAKHGRGAFVGAHEGIGVVTEEYLELVDAVKSNDPEAIEAEAMDIVIGALWLMASVRLRRNLENRP